MALKHDGNSAQKADDAMRQCWNMAMRRELIVPDHYQSVAVLLICWAEWLDTDLGVIREVGHTDARKTVAMS